jgi:ribosome maturation factor RimP
MSAAAQLARQVGRDRDVGAVGLCRAQGAEMRGVDRAFDFQPRSVMGLGAADLGGVRREEQLFTVARGLQRRLVGDRRGSTRRRCRGRLVVLAAAGHSHQGQPEEGTPSQSHCPKCAIRSVALDYGGHMSTLSQTQLRELLEPVVAAVGYDLEDVTITKAGRRSVVRVVVDRDGGVDLDAVADVSRTVSAALDDADPLGEQAYVLEVTSPGVDRPLTEPRHWRRNIGRLVTAGEVSGRISDVTDSGVMFDVAGTVREVAFADLPDGKVVVEFKRLEDGS